MKKTLSYIALFFLILLWSCQKKKYPEPSLTGQSNFYSKLSLNGKDVELNTGQNGYYMYTSFEMDSSNVYNFIAEVKQAGCTFCPNSLRIQLNDSKISIPNSPVSIDSAIQVKSYSFLSGNNEIGYNVNFAGSFNKVPSNIVWDFGDGSSSNVMSPKHVYKAGVYKVSLKIDGPGGCQSIMTNTLSLNSINDLNAFISVTSNTSAVSFSANVIGGKAPYTYFWDFGDGATSTAASISHAYAIAGAYGAKLKVSDANGAIVNCLYNVVAGGDLSACATNFTFPKLPYLSKRLGLSQCSVRYIDATGTVYTSDNALQPVTSSLDILSVEEFAKNEKNQSVKRIKIKFNCTLFSGNKTILLQAPESSVGFAYY